MVLDEPSDMEEDIFVRQNTMFKEDILEDVSRQSAHNPENIRNRNGQDFTLV